jgi:hypothetical protein
MRAEISELEVEFSLKLNRQVRHVVTQSRINLSMKGHKSNKFEVVWIVATFNNQLYPAAMNGIDTSC